MSIATYKRIEPVAVQGWSVKILAVNNGERTEIHSVDLPGRSYPKNVPHGWQRWQRHIIQLTAPINDAELATSDVLGGVRLVLIVISTGIRFWKKSELILNAGITTLELELPEDSIGTHLTIKPSFRSGGKNGEQEALDLWNPGEINVEFVGMQSWFPVEPREFTRRGQFLNLELPDPSECSLDAQDENCPLLRPLGETVRIQIDTESVEWKRLERNLQEHPPTEASRQALSILVGLVISAIRSWEEKLDRSVFEKLVTGPLPKPAGYAGDTLGWFIRSLHHKLDPDSLYKDEDITFWLQLVSRLTSPADEGGNGR
jgi:hypothetical protein